MIVTVIGASGFLGQQTVRHLLKHTDYTVRAFCRSAERLTFNDIDYSAGRLELIAGTVLEADDVQRALRGADAAIYLVHMMGEASQQLGGDFYTLEAEAAHVVARVAARCELKRLVFMGGLGSDGDKLSKHLASRHNTGRILRERLNVVIEFRASMIIGDGSVAYDIVRTIAHKLPILMVPRWAVTKTQPIILADALQYLTAALTVPIKTNQIIEIGGPDQVTYEDLVVLYGRKLGRRETIFAVPFVPRWAAITWLNYFMPPKHAGMAAPMVESLNNQMIVTNDSAAKLFPNIQPQSIERAFF